MKIIYTILLFLLSIQAFGQDAHFSVFENNNRSINPSSLGFQEFQNQVELAYRTQWKQLGSAYRNLYASFSQQRKSVFWGLQFLQQDAGNASLRRTDIAVDFAYKKQLSEQGEWIALGLKAALLQQKFEPELFRFESQFVDGFGFDESLSSGESFSSTSKTMPSLSTGISLRKNISNLVLSAGLSFAHLNRPASGFYLNSTEQLPLKIAFLANLNIPVNEKISVDAQGFYNKQHTAKVLLLGGRMNYKISQEHTVLLGAASRWKDAFVFTGGLKFEHSAFYVSYDMNQSALSKIISPGAAMELRAVFYFNQNKKVSKQPESFEDKPELTVLPEQDSDKDGVPDRLDECPLVPGKIYLNGCSDTDKDGIWDHLDQCPNLYGDQGNQGCPVAYKDTDKDGIRDDLDHCPFIKGELELDGCRDTDKDGIADPEDHCPFLKGVKKNNGCPMMNIKEHQEFTSQRTVLAVVEFDTDKSIIKPRFHHELDGVVNFVQTKGRYDVFISGHTDSEGAGMYNYELGQRRAEAVKLYLINSGVPAHLIRLVSFGETKPLDSNMHESGKSRNRRAEVFVVKE